MAFQKISKNCTIILKQYCPNLLEFISNEEFEIFIKKSINHISENNWKANCNNFAVTFFKLLDEHFENQSETIITNEFKYFNHLLGEFLKLGKNKAFKDLIKSTIYNFKHSNFKNVLGEIAACLSLSANTNMTKYERILPNHKSIDFEFTDIENNIFLVEVLNIEFNQEKYEDQMSFEKFICKRLEDKFNEKSKHLDDELKSRLIIYPILHGFNIDTIRENEFFLNNLWRKKFKEIGFNSFMPGAFGNIQGTYFSFFTIKEIIAHLNKYPNVN